MTKVEIYTFSISDKKSESKIKFEDAIRTILQQGVFTKFPDFILKAPPKDTFDDILKVHVENGKTSWSQQSRAGRVSGIIVVGRDRNKELSFSNPDEQKSNAGKKVKGLSIDKKHYFDIVFPNNKSEGFLILERTDGKSCKKHMFSLLKKFLPSIQPSIRVSFEKFLEKDILLAFLGDGDYSKLEFSRKHVPSDVMERYLGDYKNPGTYTVKTAIIPENDIDFPEELKQEIVEAVSKEQTFFTIPQLEKIGFEKNKTNLTITSIYKNVKRKIDLSNTMKLQPFYEINVNLQDDGFADYEDMKRKVTDLLKSFNLDIL